MELFDQIDLALNAHHLWRERLKAAIRTGECEYSVEIVRDSYCCDFGVWLRHLPPVECVTPEWNQVSQLHDRFHQEAANVLTHALAGEKTAAEKLFAEDGAYARTSKKLALAMTAWKPVIGEQLRKQPPLASDSGLMRHRD